MKRYNTIDPFYKEHRHFFRYTRKDKQQEFGKNTDDSLYFVHALKEAKEWLKRKRS